VTNNSDHDKGSLRYWIMNSNPGDGIDFDPILNGQTITLTTGPLVINLAGSLAIDGPGASQLTISGNSVSRVFSISGAATNVMLQGLTIADGLATQGGGIDNGSQLIVFQCVLSQNHAVGSINNAGLGGAIFNEINAGLAITDSEFDNNLAMGGLAITSGKAGIGGAIANEGSANVAAGCTFQNNEARGSAGAANGNGGDAYGGAIANVGATAFLEMGVRFGNACTLTGNRADGGAPGTGSNVVGGSAFGGGIANSAQIFTGRTGPGGATVLVDNTNLTGNRAIGGNPGSGASTGGPSRGGGIFDDVQSTIRITATTLDSNGAGTNSAAIAAGGGLCNLGTASVFDSLLQNNFAIGGDATTLPFAGSNAGDGGGGGIANTGVLSIGFSNLVGNKAIGGQGSAGAHGLGGGILNFGSTSLFFCILAGNVAQGGMGTGASGHGGDGLGGGVLNGSTGTVFGFVVFIVGNQALDGGGAASNGTGVGGGFYNLGAFISFLTFVSGNFASTSNNDLFP
jgi:hypothetical protein